MPQAEPLPQRPGKARRFVSPKPQRAKGAPPPLVHYPDSDDEPMGESFLHIDVAADARAVLVAHHIDRPDACVGCNNFVYYEEGNTEAVVVPDVFVVFGVPKRTDRRVFKVWEEGAVPDFVLEVTSKSTQDNDERDKRDLYERLGVTEYWQFDPTGDYLDPMLKGRALGADGKYRELEFERRDGGLCLFSKVLGLDLRLEEGRLRFFDPKRGEYLQVPTEQRDTIREQRRALEERDRTLEERDRALEEQRRALEAAEARIRELERQRGPEG